MHFKSEISLGDLLTAISIIISALGILYTMRHDRHARLASARVSAIQSAIQEMLRALERGQLLGEKIAWETAGVKQGIDNIEIVRFSFDLKNLIERLQCGEFQIWATDQEKRLLSDLKKYCDDWGRKFADHVNEPQHVKPISFDDFLDKLKSKIADLSDCVGATVKNFQS
jgi:hypothetical protein